MNNGVKHPYVVTPTRVPNPRRGIHLNIMPYMTQSLDNILIKIYSLPVHRLPES